MDLVTGNLLNGQLVELRIAPAVLAGGQTPDVSFIKGTILGFDHVGTIINTVNEAGSGIGVGAKFFPWTSVLDLTVVAGS